MATISTIDVNGAKPESALIAFAELDNLEVIFETFHNTRKYNTICSAIAVLHSWWLGHEAPHNPAVRRRSAASQTPLDKPEA